MKKTKRGIFALVMVLVLAFSSMTAFAANDSASDVTIIEATDGAELYDLVEDAVNDGAAKIQVNVAGILNYETFASYGSDKLAKLTEIEALTIVGTTENAKFVQTGVGVDAMGLATGTLTFKDIAVEDTTVYKSENGESAWEFCYAEYNGKVVFDNCVIGGEYGGIMTNGDATFIDCTFVGEKDTTKHGGTEYAVWVNNGSATFTNCYFTGNRAVKVHEAYGSEVTALVVDGCTFENLTEKPGIAIGDLNKETTVTVTDSMVINCKAGDDGAYIYESDTELEDFTLSIDEDSVFICPDHDPVYTPNNDATCQDNATETSKCPNCDATDTREIPNSIVEHKYSKYVYNNDATCTKDGTETAKCDFGCGAEATLSAEKTATGHKAVLVGAKEATTTEKGYTGDKVCETCKTVLEKGKEIPVKDTTSPKTGDVPPVGLYVVAIAAVAAVVGGFRMRKVAR